MSQLKYKEFTGSIDPSIEDDCLFGQILYINDCIIYEGQTMSELKAAFEASVDNYLDYCARHNKQPSKPYSGSFNVRIGSDLHRAAVQEAHRLDISLNEFITLSVKNSLSPTFNHNRAVEANSTYGASFYNAIYNPFSNTVPQTTGTATAAKTGTEIFQNVSNQFNIPQTTH